MTAGQGVALPTGMAGGRRLGRSNLASSMVSLNRATTSESGSESDPDWQQDEEVFYGGVSGARGKKRGRSTMRGVPRRAVRRQKIEAMVEGSWWDCKLLRQVGPQTYRLRFRTFRETEDEDVNVEYLRPRSKMLSSTGCRHHASKIRPGDECMVFVAHPTVDHLRHGAAAWFDAILRRVEKPDLRYGDGRCRCKFEVNLLELDVIYKEGCARTATFSPSASRRVLNPHVTVDIDNLCVLSPEPLCLELAETVFKSSSSS